MKRYFFRSILNNLCNLSSSSHGSPGGGEGAQSTSGIFPLDVYLSRRASRSHSRRQRISPSLTGPLTLRTMDRAAPPLSDAPVSGLTNSTRTCVTLPVLPVRPRTRLTFASLMLEVSCCYFFRVRRSSDRCIVGGEGGDEVEGGKKKNRENRWTVQQGRRVSYISPPPPPPPPRKRER